MRFIPRTRLLPALACMAAVLVVTGAPPLKAQNSRRGGASADAHERGLKLMLRSMRIARRWHVAGPSKSQMLAGAIEGMLGRLDPQAELYPRYELRRIAGAIRLEMHGVGLEVSRTPPRKRLDRLGYHVVAAHDGSEAAALGLKAGDLITHIDGREAGDIRHLTMTTVALQGPPGSSVRLTVERRGAAEPEPEQILLQRAAVAEAPPTLSEIEPGVLSVRPVRIDAATAGQLQIQLSAALVRPLSTPLMGIVLDLRSVAEGDAEAAAAIADQFIDQGMLLRAEARAGRDAIALRATAGGLATTPVMAIVVDAGTAGAAEVLAAALLDNDRATLVGVKTAGRLAQRAVRTIGRRGEKGAVRMTTLRYLTPKGAKLDGKGLEPSIKAEQVPKDEVCRSRDISDSERPGRCKPRTLANDARLSQAITHLRTSGAAGDLAARRRP